MDNNEFAKKFEEKVKIAKEGNDEKRKELDELKKKLIDNIQQEFLDAIPEEIPLDKEFWIFSEYIRVRYEKGNYVIENVKIKDYARLEKFMEEIAKDLSLMIKRKVEVSTYKYKCNYSFRFTTIC